MRWNRLLKSLLKTTVYILDQTAEQADRVADRTSEIRDQAKSVLDNAASAIQPQREDHTFRNLVSFAAGVGLGVGAGMLLAPASGVELRSSISDRVKDISDKVKGRVSTQQSATGTG
jgi:gas vesicle protein